MQLTWSNLCFWSAWFHQNHNSFAGHDANKILNKYNQKNFSTWWSVCFVWEPHVDLPVIYACMYVCMYEWMDVCMYLCAWMCVRERELERERGRGKKGDPGGLFMVAGSEPWYWCPGCGDDMWEAATKQHNYYHARTLAHTHTSTQAHKHTQTHACGSKQDCVAATWAWTWSWVWLLAWLFQLEPS